MIAVDDARTVLRADAREIERAIKLLVNHGETYEVRAIASTKYGSGEEIRSGYFRGGAASAAVARADTTDVQGWYITLNPVDPALHARRADRIARVGKDATTKDHHVTRRTRILIDIDPKRATGISSTDAEHRAALELADEIAHELGERGWPDPIRADSGNGAHLDYAIDLPADDGGLVERVLAAADARWSCQVGDVQLKIDESNHNPARITKLYGTPARKGDDVAERPHRLSRVLSAPESLQPVTREQLEEFVAEYLPKPEPKQAKPLPRSDGASRGPRLNAAAWLAQHGIGVASSSPYAGKEGPGTIFVLETCPRDPDHGRGEAFVIQFDSGALSAGCHHNSCQELDWKWLREHFEGPKDDFARDEDGRIYHSQDNIHLALRKLEVTIRYDMFGDRELVEGLEGFGPELDDAAMNRLRMQIDRRFGFRPSKEFFYDVISDHAQDKRFHPVRDYLDSLRWDGEPRLDGWLSRYAGAELTEYTRAIGTIVLVAAVRRARQPGCKFDEMLILESKQGTNKSTALAILARRPDWFIDDLPLGADTKRAMESTAGKWIIEAGELKGMSKGDIHALKGYVSRQTDEARMAYGRKRKVMPRQFIIIGTTNETADYLRDTTGNRRFWPVRIKEFKIEALRADRDQLWAEAARREAGGVSIRLDPALYGEAGKEQEHRRAEDSIEILLAESFEGLTGKIQITEAWKVLGIDNRPLTPDENTRFGASMRRLGWERLLRRIDGERGYCYVKGDDVQRQVWLVVDVDRSATGQRRITVGPAGGGR